MVGMRIIELSLCFFYEEDYCQHYGTLIQCFANFKNLIRLNHFY